MLVGMDLTSDLAHIECPVLVIGGALAATPPPALVAAIAAHGPRPVVADRPRRGGAAPLQILTSAILQFLLEAAVLAGS